MLIFNMLSYFPIFGLRDKKLIKKLSNAGGH